jgi:ABC-type uncharacterized transport system substrate-binding protein
MRITTYSNGFLRARVFKAFFASFLWLALLTSAASAECAWVLWQESIAPVGVISLLEAHPSMTECSQNLVGYAKTLKGNGYNISGATPGSQVATYKIDVRRGNLLCLPDTVDPRGPKGR